MKKSNQEVWVGMHDNDPEAVEMSNMEFSALPIVETLSNEDIAQKAETNRRDFLKYLGFGLGAATIAAGCEAPIRRAIPYVTKPDEIVPGVATYYASTFVNGGDYCPILVKTREGRPIKIEGNDLCPMTKGGTNARAQALVLSLYDTNRLKGPKAIKGEDLDWKKLDTAVKGKLRAASNIRIITNTIMSPTAKKAIEEFQVAFPSTKVIAYDPVSAAALLDANEQCFGDRVVPNYHFDKAEFIVSFGADFLGTWISPIEYARQYVKNRTIKDASHAKMSRHIQVECGMTVTGSNADNRILVKPSESGAAIATLLSELGGGVSAPNIGNKAKIAALAKQLSEHPGKCLVVSGSNNLGEQVLVNKINQILGSYGSTITFDQASLQRQGSDTDMFRLVSEMNSGSVDAAIVIGANPAFEYPNTEQFATAFAKVGLKISCAESIDETAALCDYVAPTHHNLEAWGDCEAKRGHYSLVQPTIAPLFNTRQYEESLLTWAGSANLNTKSDQPYYDYLKKSWESRIGSAGFASFSNFWDTIVHDGIYHAGSSSKATDFAGDVGAAASSISKPSGAELEIAFYETINIGNGVYANNPWLQEMADPVTRCVWGNYLSVPIAWDGTSSFEGFKGIGKENIKSSADFVNLTIKGAEQKVTAMPQFGQMPNTMSMGLGYGREVVGSCGYKIGSNVNPWISVDSKGYRQYFAGVESFNVAGKDDHIACVQYHHTYGVTKGVDETTGKPFNVDERAIGYKGYQGMLTDRSVIYNTNLADLGETVANVQEKRAEAKHLNDKSLYPYEEYKEKYYTQGHHWGMYVDLNACIGCSACTVACMAENNVPVVGKEEVHRHHEMAWLRIDRYYYGDVENPSTVYQPMMCQHCDNAPCENVCPVAATNHSSEGLNQMTYNRCIGTRYCANNCPYKVRRFNWLDYTTADLFPGNQPALNDNNEVEGTPFGADNLTRMVLNPDVTVRTRGVIEKCSFCVQRIQEGKLTAKKESRRLRDGDVKSACMTACPTGAITFGDMNSNKDLQDKINSPMTFVALEEINVRSSVNYSIKVNNRSEKLDA